MISILLSSIFNLEKDVVIALLPIVLDTNRAPHLSLFLEFLGTCTDKVHQRITLDQWDSFLQFNNTVKLDLSNHEDDGACKIKFKLISYMLFELLLSKRKKLLNNTTYLYNLYCMLLFAHTSICFLCAKSIINSSQEYLLLKYQFSQKTCH